jgi:hypothetical protein
MATLIEDGELRRHGFTNAPPNAELMRFAERELRRFNKTGVRLWADRSLR